VLARSPPEDRVFDDLEYCKEAAAGGHVHVLRWLRSKPVPPCPWDRSVWSYAAVGGVHVLEWLSNNSPPLLTTSASRGVFVRRPGHRLDTDVLEWLRQQLPLNESICIYAATCGSIDGLEWLRDQTPPCPWNERVCEEAARAGQFEVLKWLRGQTPPCPWDGYTFESAHTAYVFGDPEHLWREVKDWLLENDCPTHPWYSDSDFESDEESDGA
jgi:hypothetical protein